MSNDETAATNAWKLLVAESVPNAYILDGGLNGWLDTFAKADPALPKATASVGDDRLRYKFALALGAKSPAATPDPHMFALEYTPKIQLKVKRGRHRAAAAGEGGRRIRLARPYLRGRFSVHLNRCMDSRLPTVSDHRFAAQEDFPHRRRRSPACSSLFCSRSLWRCQRLPVATKSAGRMVRVGSTRCRCKTHPRFNRSPRRPHQSWSLCDPIPDHFIKTRRRRRGVFGPEIARPASAPFASSASFRATSFISPQVYRS